jgi:transposase InsO family protein
LPKALPRAAGGDEPPERLDPQVRTLKLLRAESKLHTNDWEKGHGIMISMDGKGRCMDNIFVERLWRSLKYQEVYLHA